MILAIISIVLLLVAIAFAIVGARVFIAKVEEAHPVITKKTQAVHAETKRTVYEAQRIHKDATDALLEIRRLQVRADQTVVLAETALQKAEQVLNDPRVQHALRSSNG